MCAHLEHPAWRQRLHCLCSLDREGHSPSTSSKLAAHAETVPSPTWGEGKGEGANDQARQRFGAGLRLRGLSPSTSPQWGEGRCVDVLNILTGGNDCTVCVV